MIDVVIVTAVKNEYRKALTNSWVLPVAYGDIP